MNQSDEPARDSDSPSTIAQELEKFFREQKLEQVDHSIAFQKSIERRANTEDIHKLQMQTSDQIETLEEISRSLQRHLQIISSALIALVLLGISGATFLYLQWPALIAQVNQNQGPRVAKSAEGTTNNNQLDTGNELIDINDDFAFVDDSQPITEADKAIFPVILDLYYAALQFQQTSAPGSIDARSTINAAYVQFLADATQIAERAAMENVSQELTQLIVMVVELAKQSRAHLGVNRPETDVLNNTIQATLQRYAPKGARFRRR